MHLREPLDPRSTAACTQISPGIAHPPSRLCASDLRHRVPYTYRALHLFACSPRSARLYPLPVRRASALPPASFRPPVTRAALAVQLAFPRVGYAEDFHLPVSAPCRAHKESGRLLGLPLIQAPCSHCQRGVEALIDPSAEAEAEALPLAV